MPDIFLGNLKIDESQMEQALEKAIASLSKLEQESLRALIAHKKAQDAAVIGQLEAAQKAAKVQEKVNSDLRKSYEANEKKAVESATNTARKTTSIFSGMGNSVRKALNFIGILSGIGTLAAIFSKVGRAVTDMVKDFANTKEGAKALSNIRLEWERIKAVASDFLKNTLLKILPALDKAAPSIEKGFIKVTASLAGALAGGKALAENFSNEVKIFYNNVLIGANEAKALIDKVLNKINPFAFKAPDGEAQKRADAIADENIELIKLRTSYTNVGEAYEKAYQSQLASGLLAAKNARIKREANKEEEAAIKKLREEYEKLREELSKKAGEADIAAISNPINRVIAELEKSTKEINDKVRIAKENIEKATKLDPTLNLKFDPQIEIDADKDVARLKIEAKEKIDQIINDLSKTSVDEIANFDSKTPDTVESKFKNDLIRRIQNLFAVPDSIIQSAKKLGIKIFKDLLHPEESFETDAEGKRKLDEIANQDVVDFTERLTKHSEAIQKAQDAINKKNEAQEKKDAKKNPLAKLLGLDDKELHEIERSLGDIFNSLNTIVSAGIQTRLDENQKLIDSIHERVNAAQDALDRETQLQNEGSANNVATKKRELDELKAQEAAAQTEKIALQKKALAQQLIIDELSQASSLASAIAPLFADGAKKLGLVGIIAAVAAIASMFALFASFKQKAKALSTTKAHKGGDLARDYGMVAERNGRTDQYGGRGHRVEDSDLIIGGDEYLNKASVARKHKRFLDKLNTGEYDGMDLIEVLRRREVRKTESRKETESERREVSKSVSHEFGRTESQEVRKLTKEERLVNESIIKKLFDRKVFVHQTELNELINEMISRKEEVVRRKSESQEDRKSESLKVVNRTSENENEIVDLRSKEKVVSIMSEIEVRKTDESASPIAIGPEARKSEKLKAGEIAEIAVRKMDETKTQTKNDFMLRRFMMMNENSIINTKNLETITGNTFTQKNTFATKYIESLINMRTRIPLFDNEKEVRSMRKAIRKDQENKANQSGITRDEIKEIMDQHAKDLAKQFQKTMDEKKEYIPITDATIGYKVKAKGLNETIYLK